MQNLKEMKFFIYATGEANSTYIYKLRYET